MLINLTESQAECLIEILIEKIGSQQTELWLKDKDIAAEANKEAEEKNDE